MTFTKYPKMKDSGIEWIGEIPEKWDVNRMVSIGKFSKGRNITKDDLRNIGHPCIVYSQLYTKYTRLVTSVISFIDDKKFQQTTKVNSGTFLFTSSGETIEDIGQCVLYDGNSEVSVGGDMVVFKIKDEIKFDNYFLSYVFNSDFFQYQKSANSRGEIVVHVYERQLRDMTFPVPSLSEQKQIASYIDKKTAKIDDEITKNQNLIKLLQEKRQSEINRAVTKGLDDTVPIKDSGIEWIGEIPKHWNIMKLKRLVNLSQGIQIPEDKQIDEEEKGYVRFLRIVDFTDNAKSRFVNKFDNNSFLEKDEIVMIRYGASAGKVLRGLKGVFANNMFKLISNYLLTNNFLFDFLNQQLVQDHITEMSPVTTMPNINHNIVYDLNIPLPSLNEQKQITNFIYSKTAKIDSLISKIQLQISTLQEFRTSLISSAVTGKICVTN